MISMSPAAGTQVDQGSSVAVVVSEGPENVTVPNDLVGQSLDYARQSLQQAGLTAGPVSTVNSATVPHNVVLSTDPGQGASVARDSAVKLQVSTGKVTVPDVVGRSRAEAEQALRADDVRLNYDVEIDETEDAETGTVLRQSAPAGSSVSQGSTITLTVARKVTPTPSPTPSPSPSPTNEDEPTAEPTTPAEPTDAAPEPTQPQPTSRPTASRGGDG